MSDLISASPGPAPAGVDGTAGAFPEDPYADLRSVPVWSDELMAANGLPIDDAPFLTAGGGPASFAVVDLLRVCRVPAADILVVSPQRHPYDNVRHLMRMSQIRDRDPLRSDSMSRMDNIWGFPGYAIEQALRRRSLRPLLTVLAEPVAAEYFNPTPEQVFGGMDREAARIGWASMLVPGRVEAVRRREGGGYLSLVRPADGVPPFAVRSTYVHLGTGYPAVRYTRLLSDYRARHGDHVRVVNAYEPHEHLYEILKRKAAATVVVRGSGITASRVLQRLIDERAASGRRIKIVHLFRDYVDGARGPLTSRRPGGNGWTYQAFSFPKAAGSGQLRRRMLGLDRAERAAYLRSMTATTTAKRRLWRRQLRTARAEGFYRTVHGGLTEMDLCRGRVRLLVDVPRRAAMTMYADFVIDCTGLEVDLRNSPLLADLLDHTGAGRNDLGGLDVGPHFEVMGTAQDPGQVYASGVITRGGYLAPVDSFWGFFHAAQLICDDLMRRDFCPRLGLTRSAIGWLRWLANRAP